MWLSQDGDVKMKVAHCGDAICGTIAWLKSPNDEKGKPKVDINNADASKRNRPIMGSAMILPMKADGADKWSGQVYNAEDGKTYSGSFTLAGANKADLEGLRRDHLQDQDLDADQLIAASPTLHRARWPNSTARTFGSDTSTRLASSTRTCMPRCTAGRARTAASQRLRCGKPSNVSPWRSNSLIQPTQAMSAIE